MRLGKGLGENKEGTTAQSQGIISLPCFTGLTKYVFLNQKQLLFFESEVREASLTGCILSNREMKSRAKDGNSNGNTTKNESSAKKDQ